MSKSNPLRVSGNPYVQCHICKSAFLRSSMYSRKVVPSLTSKMYTVYYCMNATQCVDRYIVNAVNH